MSEKKRKERRGERTPPPISGAGLITFYQEEIKSIFKVRPIYIVITSIVLIAAVLLADAGIIAP